MSSGTEPVFDTSEIRSFVLEVLLQFLEHKNIHGDGMSLQVLGNEVQAIASIRGKIAAAPDGEPRNARIKNPVNICK